MAKRCSRRRRGGGARSRLYQCRPQPVDGALSGITSLDPRPRLGLLEQRFQLDEKLGRPGACAVERLDPLQPLQHSACVLHGATVALGRSTMGNAFEPSVRQRAADATACLR